MAKVKYDGVLEAAHFKPDGQLDWVRVYERHGAVFSDRILLARQAFVEQLEKRKRFFVGKRIQYMGGNFEVSRPVHLLKQDGKEVIVVGEVQADEDTLTGVPII